MRWRRQTKIIQVQMLDRQMAKSNAVLRAVDQGYRSPVVLSSKRIFDLEGRPVWQIELRVGRRRRPVR